MANMHVTNLRAVDLNLFVVLDALLAERSVSRAAARIGMSQPAMSHALGRLRQTLDDPILVRTGHRMVPTARAQAMGESIKHALGELSGALLGTSTFEPTKARHVFRVAMSDFVGAILLPQLMARLSKAGPGLSMELSSNPSGDRRAELTEGSLDLAFGVFDEAAGFRRELLFRESFSCLVRRAHPAIRTRLTLKQFAAWPHVLVAPLGAGPGAVDRALARVGKERSLALKVPHFLLAPLVVAQTNYILTIPSRVAQRFVGPFPLKRFPPPVALDSFDISMVWHARAERDPAIRWLRSQLLALTH